MLVSTDLRKFNFSYFLISNQTSSIAQQKVLLWMVHHQYLATCSNNNTCICLYNVSQSTNFLDFNDNFVIDTLVCMWITEYKDCLTYTYTHGRHSLFLCFSFNLINFVEQGTSDVAINYYDFRRTSKTINKEIFVWLQTIILWLSQLPPRNKFFSYKIKDIPSFFLMYNCVWALPVNRARGNDFAWASYMQWHYSIKGWQIYSRA